MAGSSKAELNNGSMEAAPPYDVRLSFATDARHTAIASYKSIREVDFISFYLNCRNISEKKCIDYTQ